MKSNYVGLSGCDACGLGSSPVESNSTEKTTVEDTVEEAKKYSNPEIPIWVKMIAGAGAIFGLSKLTKAKK